MEGKLLRQGGYGYGLNGLWAIPPDEPDVIGAPVQEDSPLSA